jgi:hypothetical protein
MVTDQRYFLAEMWMSTEDYRSDRSPAETPLAFLTVYPTLAWAELAIFENSVGLLDSLGQLARCLQCFIGGMPAFLLRLLGVEGNGRDEQ